MTVLARSRAHRRSALIDMRYWSGEGGDARTVRSQGLRVVLFWSAGGHPTMVVDRPLGQKPTEDDEYEDNLMMRWARAFGASAKGATA